MRKNILLLAVSLAPLAGRAQGGAIAGGIYHLIKGTKIEEAREMEISPGTTWPTAVVSRKEYLAQVTPEITAAKRDVIKLTRRIDAHPDSADLYRRRAALATGDQAVKDVATARAKGSTYPELGLLLANAYLHMGSYNAAQAAAAAYQQQFPADVRPLLVSASADLNRKKGEHTGHCRTALVALNRALALDSTNFSARVMRGYALTNTNQLAAGMADYQRALAVAPRNPQVHFFLAEAYIAAGNLTAACTHFAQATEYAELTVKAYHKQYCR